MKNSIHITIFSEKFPNQCKEQTNSKVLSYTTTPHLKYGGLNLCEK